MLGQLHVQILQYQEREGKSAVGQDMLPSGVVLKSFCCIKRKHVRVAWWEGYLGQRIAHTGLGVVKVLGLLEKMKGNRC